MFSRYRVQVEFQVRGIILEKSNITHLNYVKNKTLSFKFERHIFEEVMLKFGNFHDMKGLCIWKIEIEEHITTSSNFFPIPQSSSIKKYNNVHLYILS